MKNNHSNELIRLNNAGVKRANKWLVRDVSMRVKSGEIVTLIGPNGAGKTTTAKMALGLMSLDEGTAIQKKSLNIGYVPQKLTIDWTLPLTVRRFINLSQKYPPVEIEAALNLTKALAVIDTDMKSLSGGEFQRVLLARAIVKKPDLLVLDEPVQGVDFSGEAALYQLIEDIRNNFMCGILLISHDLHMVMSSTDRVICMNGHVCCSGTPESVSSSAEFKALFGSKVASNIALYSHMHDHSHGLDGNIEIETTRLPKRADAL